MSLNWRIDGCRGFLPREARGDRRAPMVETATGGETWADRRRDWDCGPCGAEVLAEWVDPSAARVLRCDLPKGHPGEHVAGRRVADRRVSVGDRSDPIRTAAGEPIPWATTNAMIWASLAVGWGWELKEAQIPEVLARMRFLADVAEHERERKTWAALADVEILRAHVGLRTNVSPEGASWWGRIMRHRRDTLRAAAREEVKPSVRKRTAVVLPEGVTVGGGPTCGTCGEPVTGAGNLGPYHCERHRT